MATPLTRLETITDPSTGQRKVAARKVVGRKLPRKAKARKASRGIVARLIGALSGKKTAAPRRPVLRSGTGTGMPRTPHFGGNVNPIPGRTTPGALRTGAIGKGVDAVLIEVQQQLVEGDVAGVDRAMTVLKNKLAAGSGFMRAGSYTDRLRERFAASAVAKWQAAKASGKLVTAMPVLTAEILDSIRKVGAAAEKETSDAGYDYSGGGGGSDAGGADAGYDYSDWGSQVEAEDAEGGGAEAGSEGAEEGGAEAYAVTEDGVVVPVEAEPVGLVDGAVGWVKDHPLITAGMAVAGWYGYKQYVKSKGSRAQRRTR